MMTLSEADPRWAAASDIWARFGELTRFVSSTEIALEREAALWRTTDLVKGDTVKLRSVRSDGIGKYTVGIGDHISAVSGLGTLHGLVLLGYCSLAEELSRLALGNDKLVGGVEQWGGAALASNGKTFDDVADGVATVVEIFVLRNAVAHGSTKWTKPMRERIRNAGGTPPRVGTWIDTTPALNDGRPVIRKFMQCTGLTVL